MSDFAASEIVSEAEQRGDKFLVGGRAFFNPGITLGAIGQLLWEEAAFRADRHDHGILDLLGFDETEHFGAIVRGAIRPAQAAARDRAKSQMDAFDAGLKT